MSTSPASAAMPAFASVGVTVKPFTGAGVLGLGRIVAVMPTVTELYELSCLVCVDVADTPSAEVDTSVEPSDSSASTSSGEKVTGFRLPALSRCDWNLPTCPTDGARRTLLDC